MDEEMGIEAPAKKPPLPQIALLVGLIVVVAALYFTGAWKGLFEVSTTKTQMLIIGRPSDGLITVLDQDPSLVYYREQDASQLDVSPGQQLEPYDVVLLDQHLAGTAFGHSVSRQLGEALENFVRTGGTVIVVMDSGIYRSGPNQGVAADVVGWQASFGDVVPVECDIGTAGKKTCETAFFVQGRIRAVDLSHKIMEGIETAPASPELPPYSIKTFDVRPIGNIVAVTEDTGSSKTYPAIVEKRTLLGKVIYFNYDPAITPGIWQNTLEYVR